MNPQINFRLTKEFENKLIEYAGANNIEVFFPVGTSGILVDNNIRINTAYLFEINDSKPSFDFNQEQFKKMNATEKRVLYSLNPWIEYSTEYSINEKKVNCRLYLAVDSIEDPTVKKRIKEKYSLLKKWVEKMSKNTREIQVLHLL